MKCVFLLLVAAAAVTATNTTGPVDATLRPTLSPTDGVTMMPTMEEVGSSGEPARVVTVACSLTVMAVLTYIGVYVVAYDADDRDRDRENQKPKSVLW